MLEKTLTPRQRGLYLVGAVLAAAAAAVCGWGASRVPREPEHMRFVAAYAVLTAAALLVVTGIYFAVFWKGVVSPRLRLRGWAVIGVAYVGLLGWLFLATARLFPELLREEVRVLGLVLLVYAAAAWARHRVAQAEVNTAEKLLEIELRLAEMGEAREGQSRPADPAPPPPA